MRILSLAVIIVLLGAVAAFSGQPRVMLTPLSMTVGGDIKSLQDGGSFEISSNMFIKKEPKSFYVNDESFIIRVRITNYGPEEFGFNGAEYLTKEEWVISSPYFVVDLGKPRCEEDDDLGLGKEEEAKICPPIKIEVEPLSRRSGKDVDLYFNFTEKIQHGKLDLKIGLKAPDARGADEDGVIWADPLKLDIDPWPVRSFMKVWEEKTGWANMRKDMRENQRTGLIKRRYLTGELMIEENYRNGTLNGTRKFYYKNGVAQEEAEFLDDELHGERFLFQSNKELERFEIYRYGELLGAVRFTPFEIEREKQKKIHSLRARVEKELNPPEEESDQSEGTPAPSPSTDMTTGATPHTKDASAAPAGNPVPPTGQNPAVPVLPE